MHSKVQLTELLDSFFAAETSGEFGRAEFAA